MCFATSATPKPIGSNCVHCWRHGFICVLDERKLTMRAAQDVTGIAAADFSRIRKVNLGRFTIDRLMTILARLGQEVEVKVDVHPRRAVAVAAELCL